jgi:hypothetical protein
MALPVMALVIGIPGTPFLVALLTHEAVLGIGMVFPAVVFGLPALLALRSRTDMLIGMKDGGKKLLAAIEAVAGLSSHCMAPGMESNLRFSASEAPIESSSVSSIFRNLLQSFPPPRRFSLMKWSPFIPLIMDSFSVAADISYLRRLNSARIHKKSHGGYT